MAENGFGINTETPVTPRVPDKPALEGLEDKLTAVWQNEKLYEFRPETSDERVYSIDTPPPTASGSLHVGHMFGYTPPDVIARYKRMRGYNVFYPLGWDDNGLPTERRVQNYYGVRCDPRQPYDPDYIPPKEPAKNQRDWDAISRKNFIELCEKLTIEDEQIFKQLFTSIGLSVDWRQTYRTIDDASRTASQRAFIRDVNGGHAYTAEAPTLWDVTFRTAVAQAELEAKDHSGAYYRIPFASDSGAPVYVETTRPELLAACVALVVHPNDDQYASLVGRTVRSPLFEVEIKIEAHHLADPDKGSGIAMICTFGDTTDVTWWRELQLPTRAIVGRDGRLMSQAPDWISSESGREYYTQIAGKTIHSARVAVEDLLRERGLLDGDPRPVTREVNFYEKGDKPLEIVTSRQWYIRNGGRDKKRQVEIIKLGREIEWHPNFMRSRFENWVENLNGDWLVSRQRFFGVPIPVWYALDENENRDYSNPIIAREEQLPVDPSSEPAPGFSESQRGLPGGFVGEKDILDTWATSSLTPHIAGKWEQDRDFFERVFPFDLRPQGHDIIRTWLFSTMVRSATLHDSIPWRHVGINGWILDPDRKKMSKSKGNVVIPDQVLEQYGADAVRYWAASAKLGADTAYEVAQMKIGRRLAIKILNASKFALNLGVTEAHILHGGANQDALREPLDEALLAELRALVVRVTHSLEEYDYARSLKETESFFWSFTDDYVEMIKSRAYGLHGVEAQASVRATLATTLDVILRLFAPMLPFVTDEVWRWWREGSVHTASWPSVEDIPNITGEKDLLTSAARILSGIRKSKSDDKLKNRTRIESATLVGSTKLIRHSGLIQDDLLSAVNLDTLNTKIDEKLLDEVWVTDLKVAQEE